MKSLLGVLGLVLGALGWAMTNYADHSDPVKLEHHREWAGEHGLPEPSRTIHHGGVGGLVVGSFLVGWFVGRPGRKKR